MKFKGMNWEESSIAKALPYGTQWVQCSKLKCKWVGKERDFDGPLGHSSCPQCGNDSYYFVKEVK